MKISPNELSEQGYIVQDELVHQDLVPFIKTYLKKPTFSSRLYTTANVILFGLLVALFVYQYKVNSISIGMGLSYSSFGITIAFLLIPIHEYIHVVAYKYVGAEHTSYDANWKKFYFMALADRFVASHEEFKIIALAPFVTITILGLVAFVFTSGLWSYTPLATVVVHAAFCSGDFGLLSYFDFHKDNEVVTYDDVSEGRSYFLVK